MRSLIFVAFWERSQIPRMDESMKYNLEQVAKQAGVSRSTVSRVVNEDPNVSAETRARVLTIIKHLNYQPNAAARGLAAGRTRVLGLVIPMTVAALFTDPYFPLLIQGVANATSARDHSVMLWLAEPEYERRTIRQVLHNGMIDGVLVASQRMDDPVIDALVKSALPFVLIGRHPSNAQVSYVDVDNKTAARDAVAYLLRLGRRRVATITGPKNMIAGSDRVDGYLTAIRTMGITPDPELIMESDFTEEGGYIAAQRLLRCNFDGLFAASDAMAAGALRAFAENGRRVPEDVAVVGFDDMPFAARTVPPLTTVRQPIRSAGSVAAEMLMELIGHPDVHPRRILLPTELVIRASTPQAN